MPQQPQMPGQPPMPQQPQMPPMMHDVVVHRTSKDGRIVIDNVPPSEFLINREAKSIEDARFNLSSSTQDSQRTAGDVPGCRT